MFAVPAVAVGAFLGLAGRLRRASSWDDDLLGIHGACAYPLLIMDVISFWLAMGLAFYAVRLRRRVDALRIRLDLVEQALARVGAGVPASVISLALPNLAADAEAPAPAISPDARPGSPHDLGETGPLPRDDSAELAYAARVDGSEASLGRDAPGVKATGTDATYAPAVGAGAAPSTDWERWIGTRGAGALGGAVLALAAIYFFKILLDQNLIPPAVRVAGGVLFGLGCILFTESTVRKRYGDIANSLAGVGVVTLYAAFWAAHTVYHLVPAAVTWVLMVLVTGTGGLLAIKHASRLIACLGLVGGFITPLLLASGDDRPLGLFGYLLLLNLGGFLVARAFWPRFTWLTLAATLFYQVAWIGMRMGPDRLLLGLAVLLVFALAFVLAGHFAPAPQRAQWLGTQSAAVLFPFLFMGYLALRGDLAGEVLPMGGALLLFTALALWLNRADGTWPLAQIAVAADLGVAAVWLFGDANVGALWHVHALGLSFGLLAALALVLHARRPGAGSPATAALLGTGGWLFLDVLSAATPGPGPGWQVSFALPLSSGCLAALVFTCVARHQRMPRAQVAATFGLGTLMQALLVDSSFVSGWQHHDFLWPALAMIATVVLWEALFVLRSAQPDKAALHAAALLACMHILACISAPDFIWDTGAGAALVLGLGLTASLTGALANVGQWHVAALVCTALAQQSGVFDIKPGTAWQALLGQFISVLLFTFMYSVRLRADAPARTNRFTWYAAALAAPLWFIGLYQAFTLTFGHDFIAVLPVALAAVQVLFIARARVLWRDAPAERLRAFVWFGAVALGLISVAIPLQLSHEWLTVGWALEAAAATLLWRRLNHPGLKYWALVLHGCVFVRLMCNPEVLVYHLRSGIIGLNWLSYTYLTPAACMVVGSIILAQLEIPRLRPVEAPYYARNIAWGAALCGLGAIVLIFAWINLSISDYFGNSATLDIFVARAPAHDLTTSIAWALYSVILLVLGIWRQVKALRWIALMLLSVTFAKVFLYDLGELDGFFRVLSLAGLGVSLFVVAWIYTRFIVTRE